MITMNGIKKSLTKLLSQAFPDCHIFTEDIRQIGAENGDAFPLLHIQLELQGSELAMGADTRDKSVMVDITYMEEGRSQNQTMYRIQERLETAVGIGFFCGERFLHVEDIQGNVADDLLHVTFPLAFNDAVPQGKEEWELFGNLEIRM